MSQVRHIKAKERVAYGVECAHCTRDSLEMNRAGLITWKSPHGDNNNPHPNAVSIQTLVAWGVTVLDAATLKEMRRMIDEGLNKVV